MRGAPRERDRGFADEPQQRVHLLKGRERIAADALEQRIGRRPERRRIGMPRDEIEQCRVAGARRRWLGTFLAQSLQQPLQTAPDASSASTGCRRWNRRRAQSKGIELPVERTDADAVQSPAEVS